MGSVAQQHVQQKEENDYVELEDRVKPLPKDCTKGLLYPISLTISCHVPVGELVLYLVKWQLSKLILIFAVTFDTLQKTPSVLMMKLIIEGILLFFLKENHPN